MARAAVKAVSKMTGNDLGGGAISIPGSGGGAIAATGAANCPNIWIKGRRRLVGRTASSCSWLGNAVEVASTVLM